MSASYRKKPSRGRNNRFNCNDNKTNFRNQDNSVNYIGDRKKLVLSDLSMYTIARFLMGNEVQILTMSDKFEGVLRTFDSMTLGLSQVFVYDTGSSENVPIVKRLCEYKEILLRDILHIKMLNINGKMDSVILDQEISQRKQISKTNLNEDKNLVPYFDEDESQLHSNDEDDSLNTILKTDQKCWYHPEIMLKVNEERFNVKKTFSETMEEYTTQIDKSDPLLKEKMERAERLAKEIEDDNNQKRGRLLDDDDGQDEEIMFSAVVPSAAVMKCETPIAPLAIKLNPNAPEFRPRLKPQPDEIVEPLEELHDNCQTMTIDVAVHQQQQQQHQQQQQQQQQQMIQFHRLALQQLPSMTSQINPQIQSYPAQRMIPNQWSLPMQGPASGQYMLQSYIQPNQVIQQMLPARQMQQEAVPAGSVYYQLSPFLIPQDHPLSAVNEAATHLYPSTIDANNQLNHTNPIHQLRQSHILNPNIPIIQTNQMSLHQQQQHQQQQQQNHQQQQQQQQQQLTAYYQQTQQHAQPINPANYQHIMINQQQQPQLQNGATLQGYITNGRQ